MTRGTERKWAEKIVGILMLGILMGGVPLAFGQNETPAPETTTEVRLFEPVEKQIIQLTDEGALDDWHISGLETYGLKFLIRGKEALTWSLSIEDGGFHNEAILKSYSKVLSIVNSLFVLGLLAIAIMWMFSILVPRKYLKKVILIYGLAVMFINFALPLNQLFIDGTNLLQKTLLTEKNGTIQITDIVHTPAYNEALIYQDRSEASKVHGKNGGEITLRLTGSADDSTAIGKIRSVQGEEINEDVISLSNREISLSTNSPFNVHQEQAFFRFILLMATGVAYFLMALVFVLRIIILWALLILSPMLLLLAIFRSTRGWFLNWLSLYGRWLLIGPLTALGLAIVVNIWQISGLPITVNDTYAPEVFSAAKTSNIAFYLPGKDTANTLSNTQEMMEYMIFLFMIYLPVFLGFTLTRRKVLHESLVAVTKKLISNTQTSQQQLIQQALAIQEKDEEKRDRPMGLVESFRHIVNDKIGVFAETAMPVHKLKVTPETPTAMMPTASNFLPENLGKTPVPKMLELLGMQRDSKDSRRHTIEKLAHMEKITDRKVKEKVMAVMNEIETRAGNKNNEALAILHEVETIKEIDIRNSEATVVSPVQINPQSPSSETVAGISINVNEAKPEADRKVRDSSLDSKSEKKAKDQNQEKKKEKGESDNEEGKKSTEMKDEPSANPDKNAN